MGMWSNISRLRAFYTALMLFASVARLLSQQVLQGISRNGGKRGMTRISLAHAAQRKQKQ